MLCTSPRDAWQPLSGGPLVFKKRYTGRSFGKWDPNWVLHPLKLPCGQCLSCRIDVARQVACRCVHEAQMRAENTFITLTYAPEFLPEGGTLVKSDFQKFAKDLRERVFESDSKAGRPRREMPILYCGEYGEKRGRPHFHAAIFGYRFPDEDRVEDSYSGCAQFDSPMLSDVWGKGRTRIGTLNFDSSAYIARYTVKKVTGKDAPEHYGGRTPEFCQYPKRPALGRVWFEQYYRDVFPRDQIVILRDGVGYPQRPPRYYVKLLERVDSGMAKRMKDLRRWRAAEMLAQDGELDPEMTWQRQLQRRDALIEKFKLLRRDLEL